MVVDITNSVVCVREFRRRGVEGYMIGELVEEVSRYYPRGKVVVCREVDGRYEIESPVLSAGALISLDGKLIDSEMLVEVVVRDKVRVIEQEIVE